jgi:UDP-N-acetylglucosamine:LPS N-acetylglucosamine transferase
VVITEAELSPEKLAAAISEVLADPQRAEAMGRASRTLATPDATKNIVDLIAKIQRD